jgi:RNA polymerase sigma-70 factor (ECF subfamily)
MIEQPASHADEALRQVIRQAIEYYQSPLLRYAARFVYESDVAQDIVQEAFIRLHRDLYAQKTIKDIRAWLFRVTRNLAIDECRQHGRFRNLESVSTEALATPPDLDCGDRKKVLSMANAELAKLPTNYREVIALKIIEGLTFREIAAITGEKIPALHFRLKKGLGELSRRLAVKVERG